MEKYHDLAYYNAENEKILIEDALLCSLHKLYLWLFLTRSELPRSETLKAYWSLSIT